MSAAKHPLGDVLVTVMPNPLAPERTVSEWAAWEFGRRPRDYAPTGMPIPEGLALGVSVNGRVLTEFEAACYEVQPGDSVFFRVVPRDGGGDGGSDGLGAVVSLGMMMLAPGMGQAIGVWAFNAGIMSSVGAGLMFGKIMAGVVSLAVTGIVSTVLSPSSAGKSSAIASNGLEESATYKWDSSTTNPVQPGGRVPKPYGHCHNVKPQRIARHITTDGDKQYLNLLFLLGEGPVDAVQNIKIDGNPLSNYDSVETVFRPGTRWQDVIPWFNDGVYEHGLSLKLSRDQEWSTARTMGTGIHSIGIGITCPALCQVSGTALANTTVKVEAQYKTASATEWTVWNTFEITAAKRTAVMRYYRINDLAPAQYDVRVRLAEIPPSGTDYINDTYFEYMQEIVPDDFRYPYSALLAVRALATDKLSSSEPVVTCDVLCMTVPVPADASLALPAHNLFADSSDFTASTWLRSAYTTITPAAKAAPDGTTSGQLAQDTSSEAGKQACVFQREPLVAGESGVFTFSVHVAAGTSSKVHVQMYEYVAGVSAGVVYIEFNPATGAIITNPAPAMTTLEKVGASDWWRVSVKKTMSGGATGAANDFIQAAVYPSILGDRADNAYLWGAQLERGDLTPYIPSGLARRSAENPAWMAYDMVRARRYGCGFQASRVILAEFASAAEWDDIKGIKGSMYFDTPMDMLTALGHVGNFGRFRVVERGTRIGCISDRPASTPKQGFLATMGNTVHASCGLGYIKASERADGVQITYFDKDKGNTTIFVPGPWYNTLTRPPKIVSHTLAACNDVTLARAYGDYLMRCNRYLSRTWRQTLSWQALGFQEGDVVQVANDVMQWGQSGLIRAGATLLRVPLDRPVTLEPNTAYVITIMHQDRRNEDTGEALVEEATLTVVSVATETDEVVLATPLQYAPAKDAAFSVGEAERNIRLFRVDRIRRTTGMRFAVEGLEYAAEVYEDSGEEPVSLPPTGLAAVRGLRAAVSQRYIDGLYQQRLQLFWRGAAIDFYVWKRRVGETDWTFVTTTKYPAYDVPGLETGFFYQLCVSGSSNPADGQVVDVDFTGDNLSGIYEQVVEMVNGVEEPVVETINGVTQNVFEVV